MRPATTSVVVCAYTLDRWDELVAAVRTAAGQGPDQVLLVIDHNDALHHRAVAELADVAGVTVLANTRKRGLSGARNTAIQVATGDLVVFLDDDATPQPGWLAALTAPYADPAVIAVGGAARPVWPVGAARPVTLPADGDAWGELDWVVGCSYTGLPRAQADVRNLMGCNMSFRREVLAGGFAEGLGRIGRTPLGCEETELCIRARQARPEARIVFEPAAEVGHHVSRDRLTWSYLLRRGWAEGISKAAVAALVGGEDATSTERGYVARVLPRGVLRQLRGGPTSATGAVAIVAVLAATVLGYLRGRTATGGRAWIGRRGPGGRLGSTVAATPEPPLTSSP